MLELRSRRSRCRFALRVQLAGGRSSYVAVAGPPRGGDAPYPRLVALVALEPATPDALVLTGNGASAGFYGLAALRGGRLVWLGAGRGRFGSGASRWALAVDCWRGARSGVVVSSFAEPSYPRTGWDVRRSLFAVRGTRFRVRSLAVLHVGSLRRLPEFARVGPFPSCTIATARH